MRLWPKKKLFGALGLGAIIFLPQLLSTTPGNLVLSKVCSGLLDASCHLEGSYSYFRPQKIDDLKISYDKIFIDAQNISIDRIFMMLVKQEPIKAEVSTFKLYLKDSQEKIKTIEAGIQPLFLSRSFGFYADISLKNGIFYDQNQLPVFTNISGSASITAAAPFDLKLSGDCGNSGFIKLNTQFDPLSSNIQTRAQIKDCPPNAIPDSFVKPLVTSNFDLDVSYKGSLDIGEAVYKLESSSLSADGAFHLHNRSIVITEPNNLKINLPKPYEYQDLKAQGLSGFITVKEAEITLGQAPQIKNLFCNYQGGCSKISFRDKQSGPFDLTGSITQEQNRLKLSSNLQKDKQVLLNANASYLIDQGILETATVQAQNIPVIFPFEFGGIFLGDMISFNLDLTQHDKILSAKLSASTNTIKSFNTNFKLEGLSVSLSDLNARFEDAKKDFTLNAQNLAFNPNKPDSLNGDFQISVLKWDELSQKIMPLNGAVKLISQDQIRIDLSSPVGTLGGVGALSKSFDNFIFKDTWKGAVSVPSTLYEITYAKSDLKGSITIPSGSSLDKLPVSLKLDPFYLNTPKDLMIKDFETDIEAILKTGSFKAKSKAGFYHNTLQNGQFQAQLAFENGVFKNGDLNLKNPPLDVLGGFNQDVEKLSRLFGKNLTLEVNLRDQGQSIDVGASSENLKLQGGLGFKDRLYLLRPIKGSLHVTSLDLPFIKSNLPFQLKKPFDVDLELKSLDIPSLNASIDQLLIEGDIKLLNLFLEQNRKVVQIDALKSSFSKKKGQNPLQLNLDADIYSSYDKVITSGLLNASMNIGGLNGPLHNIDTSNSTQNWLIKLENFPVLAFDFLQSRAKLPFSSTFGETLNGKLELDHTPQKGSFRIFATGKDTLLKLNATQENGLYRLNDDVIFQARLSPELSKFLFYSKPLGIEELTSDYPLVCRISAQNSQFTLFPFKTEMLSLSSCMFDFGRVLLNTSTVLPQALNLLKSSSRGNNLAVWFQPIRTSIQKGLMNVSRFDFLLQDAFQMALWGDVDFNQRQVGLVLGLTASCLQKAFGIAELPKSYVLQVPVYGSFDDVKIDSKKATGKIAKILALQTGGSLLEQFGGKGGGALGGVLKELSKIPDGDKKAPDPQTPFPWEKTSSKTSSKNSETPENKKAIRSTDSPVKQLMKLFF